MQATTNIQQTTYMNLKLRNEWNLLEKMRHETELASQPIESNTQLPITGITNEKGKRISNGSNMFLSVKVL